MTYTRSPLLDLIDAYVEFVGFHVSNTTTHLVTEDYNLDDYNLESQLKWIKENKAEWLTIPNDSVNAENIAIAVAFLKFLKSIPEARRCEHDDGEDESLQFKTPKMSEDWLRRHGGAS